MAQTNTTAVNLKEIKHNQCQQTVYTAWVKDDKGFKFFDDKEGKNLHKCSKQQYQRKKLLPEEAHKLNILLIEFAIAEAIDTLRKHKEFNPEFDQRQVLILAEVLYKGLVELCK